MITNNLFKNAIVFSDLHFGLRHNSAIHNQDCLEYVQWLVNSAKERNAETCIFLGDFSHHRNTINTQTLDFMILAIKLLNNNFKKVYMIVGNHDMYWREHREITSVKFASLFPNIILIDSITETDNVAFVPWLVGDEWMEMTKIKSKYIFGHLELPGFKMNAMVDMPDHGMLNATHFQHQDRVFSGHFHLRQTKGKITYIGNPFGHNYGDSWDFERGAMYLEWDKEPEFLNYESGPRFINITLSSLLANPDLYLKSKTYLQVTLDIDATTYEDASFLRETFLEQYNVREFKLIRNPSEDISNGTLGDVTFKTVDEIVTEGLVGLDRDISDINALIEIYNRL